MRTELNLRVKVGCPDEGQMSRLGMAIALLDAGEISTIEFCRRARLIVDLHRQARKFPPRS